MNDGCVLWGTSSLRPKQHTHATYSGSDHIIVACGLRQQPPLQEIQRPDACLHAYQPPSLGEPLQDQTQVVFRPTVPKYGQPVVNDRRNGEGNKPRELNRTHTSPLISGRFEGDALSLVTVVVAITPERQE